MIDYIQKSSFFSCVIFIVFVLSSMNIYADMSILGEKIDKYCKGKKAKIGVAVMDLDNKDTMTLNNNHHYTMMSVYKFHLALAILHEIDLGKYKLDTKIKISKKELRANTYSPLKEKYPDTNITLTIAELIEYSVGISDNNACDILFKHYGGTKKTEKYIKSLGIADISIKLTELQMHQEDNVSKNWTKPLATVELLEKFYKKNILSKSSFDFLYKVLLNSSNDSKRIKGLLPSEAIVAHKTGTSGKDSKGRISAVNDIGIISNNKGKHYAIAIFVNDSELDYEQSAKCIAEISKITWDYFLEN